ncbi:phosphate/phosphite/phosphonate ABC transporter substrate-binding protein [Brooklawnia cerclae]|uniref:Phosphonate transport system substrate-binding protein n=1 Tax=Brooklawnia cerclae TaxID=349934 RepID=A0ABX0SHV6_9ACTN|nr:phosphate/phosphite/phosphonate ABC transporter substrate-binding protein [Brooklawnia cerclae]NIH57992.1 phosphonate transport system substrate-binding protein [Brooklawnia cerclae]
MRSVTRIAAAAVAGLAALAIAGCGSDSNSTGSGSSDAPAEKTTIVFAAVPSEESSSLQAQYDVLLQKIEKDAGVTIEFQEATNYAAVIEGQRSGQIDIAGYGPFSYKIAKDSGATIEPVGSMVSKEGAEPGYSSYLWTKSGSGITTIDDVKGKTVCFVDKASTSGYLYPSAGLLEVGIDPEADITPVMAGSHDGSLLTLSQGGCDAAFAYDTMMSTLSDKGSLNEADYTKIWESEMIMGSPVAINTETLSADQQEKISAAILDTNVDSMVEQGYCTDADSCQLPEDKWGFAKVTDADYDGIRKVCDLTKSEACEAA